MNSEFVRFIRLVVCGFFLLGLYGRAAAQSRYPLCPIEAAQQPLPVLRPAIKLQVPQEVLRAAILFPRHEMKFEVRTSPKGQLVCVSPLDATFSLFWPFAMEAIERELAAHPLPSQERRLLVVLSDPRPLPENGKVRVIITSDPYNPPPELLKDPEAEALTCDSKDVDVLLDGVRLSNHSISDPGKFTKGMQCANAALALASDSFAVQYVAGLIYSRVAECKTCEADDRAKEKLAALEHYKAAVALAPGFYEAREVLANALHEAGEVAEAESTYLGLAERDNPSPVQRQTEVSLTLFYDKENDRPHALLAARKALQLKEVRDSLEAKCKYSSANLDREELAAREEEAGEYAQAASDYLAARDLTDPKLYYDAVFFKYDMGRARSLRATGDTAASDELCREWHSRASGASHLLHLKDDAGGSIDWGGRDVARATWEFSCRDYQKGVQDLFEAAEARLDHPTDKSTLGTWPRSDQLYLAAPFDALESAFLSRRQSDLAQKTRSIKKLIPNLPNKAELDHLKEMTNSLMSDATKAQ